MNYKECVTYIASLAMLLLVASCTGHDDLDITGGEGVAPGVGGAYVTLSLSIGSRQEGTRANDDSGTTTDDTTTGDDTTTDNNTTSTAGPTGGEDGDGSEVGQDYENEIDFVRLYFFKQDENDKGVNGPADTPVAATADFSRLITQTDVTRPDETQTYPDKTLKVYSTETRRVELAPGTYDIVAVANVDPTTLNDISTLGDLRDHVQKTAWLDYGNGRYGRFVMASADEATVTIDSDNDIDKPTEAVVDVERHAARVDYKTLNSYDCKTPAGNNATVKILGAGLVNNLTAGTYMLKRVADDIPELDETTATLEVTYLGKENPNHGMNTNYVIDPWTLKKKRGDESINSIFGTHYTQWDKAGEWNEYIKEGTLIGDSKPGWKRKRVAYTMENTTKASETSQMHNTGIVFKAKFHPVGLAKDNPNYKDGSTFFRAGIYLYADIESIIEAFWANKNPDLKLDGVKEKIAACDDANALKTFAETLPEGDQVGYREHLVRIAKNSIANAGTTTTMNWTDSLDKAKWETFMETEYGYKRETVTETNDNNETNTYIKVTVSEGENNTPHTRKLLDPRGIAVYKDAICFYVWWIRHCNNNDDTHNGLMEFAIVRNNIYELEVTSIAGLGSPIIPTDERIKIRVYVRDWILLPEETMAM